MQTISWSTVLEKTVQFQSIQRLCVVKDLSAHDVVMRIMRKDNFLIGMLNKGVLAMPIPRWVPGVGPVVHEANGTENRLMLTKTLEWTLNWCILQNMFDRNFTIRTDFIKNPALLRKRLIAVGFGMLILSPFLIIFMLVYFFLRHAEQFYNRPSTVASPRWSNLSRWLFREFNEAVYYHSHGLKLNPNLYETGKVCLSLLNTWTGRGNEIWDPKISSILQVLISLQGLVLNARPYFNEAGYDKQIGTAEGEKNSLAYNENSFLLTCKLMLYLLHRPPQHFEGFVKDHFRRCRHFILAACDAYMKGAEVGSLSEVPSSSCSVPENNSSVGFRLMLAKVIPKLQSAFNELGRDDHQSL